MEGVEQPRKRMLTDKQKEALKEGRQRRWEALGVAPPSTSEDQELSKNIPEEREQQQKMPSHPFFDMNSSESSESEDSDEDRAPYSRVGEIPQLQQQKSKKPKIPKAIKRRVDRYIQQKLQESMTPSAMTMNTSSSYVPPQPGYRLQYL
jgi:hypothetical protein